MTNSELFETLLITGLLIIGFLLFLLWRALYELRTETQAHARDKALLDKMLAEHGAAKCATDDYGRRDSFRIDRVGGSPLPYKIEPNQVNQQGTCIIGRSTSRELELILNERCGRNG